MLLKNVSGQGVYLYAWDNTNSVAKTGDAANITGSYSLDGGAETSGFTTAHPTEVGGGVYWQPLTAAETNGNLISYRWASSTAGIVVDPAFEHTSGTNLPAVAYAGSGGLPTVGTGTGQLNVSGGDVTAKGLRIEKNTALAAFPIVMRQSGDHYTPLTLATVTVQRSLDGAAFADCTNTPATEVGGGLYKIDLTAADTNANVVVLKATAGSGDTRFYEIITQTP